MIVDDHAMVRSGIRAFLKANNDLQLVAEAGNGLDALKFCLSEKPDVLLMDLKMPGVNGLEATRHILDASPQTKVIALTNSLDPQDISQMLQAGAAGFLSKSVSADELAAAIRNAHEGRAPLSQEAADVMVQYMRKQPRPGSDLTERELEVLALLVNGASNAQIAERLSISLATAKFHVGSILSKLGAANRAEAVTIAWQKKLVKRD
jgi:NarL family two-component system response regulator LiaR